MKQNFYIYALGWLLGLVAHPVVAQTAGGPWTTVPSAPRIGSIHTFTMLQLPTSNVVWVSGQSFYGSGRQTSTVAASSDDGLTWQFISTPDYVVRDVWALDGQKAWMIKIDINGTSAQLFQTTTGPKGFALAPAQLPGSPLSIHFFTDGIGLAVSSSANGTNWSVYRTIDGGLSWQLATNIPVMAASAFPILCALGTHLWLVTGDGRLLRTPDMGLTWTVTNTPDRFYQLAFRNARNGLAYGASRNNPLYQTTDGGATWDVLNPSGPRKRDALTAIPGSAGTYLSVESFYSSYNAGIMSPGTAISYDDGHSWQDLGGDRGSGADSPGAVVADGTGRAWALDFLSDNILRYTAATLLAATSPAVAERGAVYPNPTAGVVHLPATGTYRAVAVYDAAGKQCGSATLGTTETLLDLSNLKSGLYLLRFTGGSAAPQQQRLVVAP